MIMNKNVKIWIAGLFACIFSAGTLVAQEKKNVNDTPLRKLHLAHFAIANLYVDETDENKLVLRFTRKPYLVAYVRRFCADCFTDCWIHQLLMTKYNEEHETNE